MPAGEIGGADVADLARFHQRIERLHGFLKRRLTVPLMHLIEIDGLDAEAAQARLASRDQVLPRQALIVRAWTHGKARLGRHQQPVTSPFQGLPENFFGASLRIDIGRIHDIDPGIEAEVELTLGAAEIGRTGLGKKGFPAEGHGTEGKG